MKRISKSLLPGLLAIGLFSCNKSDLEPGTGKDLVLTATEQQKVAADNKFTLKLFKGIGLADSIDHNVFMSPLSVSFAMAMTANGAKGATLDSINKVMEFTGFTRDDVNNYYNKLVTDLPQLDPNTKLNIANSIWYRQGFNVLPDFISVNTTKYQAQVQALDFGSASAKNTINDWVSGKTNGKIPTIINAIPTEVQMYLINAIYFKSTWKAKFDAANTAKKPFYLQGGGTVQADLMSKEGLEYKTNFIPADSTRIAEIPYVHDKYSMVIVLPGANKTVKQVLSGLTADKWQSWMSGLYQLKGRVIMPKFKFSYGKTLNQPLSSLGMSLPFSNSADLSGINGNGGLKITEVMHKAFVEVNEEGTEAAAATSVSVGVTAPAPSPDLVLDRPFMFAIREMKTGLIIFAGIINNPTLAGQ
ncbi:serpin family protein [Mucilaginibacter terrenus]|uniref:Serpin family protein n=1 Tax=Mucilaginibacter terrenus TaxID=2482727 RepID=A0A3E2NQW5_9SPHI|nr:serpin family protein [Mucilaginibacter terrenus]RFZ83388.1 serpin family protein [Mucilaginibacter terrenus]